MLTISGLSKWKKFSYSIIFLLIIFLGFNCFLVSARSEDINGFSAQRTIYPYERVSYHFLNNITFEISTDT
ncbi:MAG: hypothetical protein ACFFCL_01850, partial [Promethearchaeota archaeon]